MEGIPQADTAETIAQRRETRGLNHLLGIHFTCVEADRVEAVMPITPDLFQPYGLLHGGATIALLEAVASAGGEVACDAETEQPFGVHCDIRHRKSGREGTLRGVAQLTGRRPSSRAGYYLEWGVTAFDDAGDVVSEGVFEVKVVPKDYLAAKLAERDRS